MHFWISTSVSDLTFGDLYRQFDVQKLSVLSLFLVCMIQNPQTWCQIEAFALKNKVVFTESL